jgi:uncharacterized protein
VTSLLQPFWDACAAGSLVFQRCSACGARRWPPRERCRRCHSAEYAWEQVEGDGEVASFSVVHRAFDRDFAECVPYVVALVAIGDVLYLANLVDCDPEAVSVGMPVHVVFRETPKGVTLPQFSPTGREEE